MTERPKSPFLHLLTSDMRVSLEALHELMCEFPDALPPEVAAMQPGEVFLMRGVPVLICSTQDVEASNSVLVCERWVLRFKDDVRGVCSRCGHAIRFRPYMPKMTKVCIVCIEAEAAKELRFAALREPENGRDVGGMAKGRKEWNQ